MTKTWLTSNDFDSFPKKSNSSRLIILNRIHQCSFQSQINLTGNFVLPKHRVDLFGNQIIILFFFCFFWHSSQTTMF